jgi:hypothetical protein
MRGLVYIGLASLCAAHGIASWPTRNYEQQQQQQSITPTNRVPGSNNATYGSVPIGEQIFDIEYLEIAPWPIPTYEYLTLPPKQASYLQPQQFTNNKNLQQRSNLLPPPWRDFIISPSSQQHRPSNRNFHRHLVGAVRKRRRRRAREHHSAAPHDHL